MNFFFYFIGPHFCPPGSGSSRPKSARRSGSPTLAGRVRYHLPPTPPPQLFTYSWIFGPADFFAVRTILTWGKSWEQANSRAESSAGQSSGASWQWPSEPENNFTRNIRIIRIQQYCWECEISYQPLSLCNTGSRDLD
jgi:hypothetical protein